MWTSHTIFSLWVVDVLQTLVIFSLPFLGVSSRNDKYAYAYRFHFMQYNSSNSIYDNCSMISIIESLYLTAIWIITTLPIYIWSIELARFNFCSGVCLSCNWLFVPFCYLWLSNLHLLNDPECFENRKRIICYKSTPVKRVSCQMLKLNKIQLGIIKPGLALNKVHTCILELLNSEVDWVILILVLKLLVLEKRT